MSYLSSCILLVRLWPMVFYFKLISIAQTCHLTGKNRNIFNLPHGARVDLGANQIRGIGTNIIFLINHLDKIAKYSNAIVRCVFDGPHIFLTPNIKIIL